MNVTHVAFATTAASIYLITALTGFLSNILFSLTIIMSAELRKSQFFRFALSMSICDLSQLVVLIFFCIPSTYIQSDLFNRNGDGIFGTWVNVGWYCGSITLLCQAVNRLVALKYPQYNERIYSNKSVVIMIGATWLIAMGLASINALPFGYEIWDVKSGTWGYVTPLCGYIDLTFTCGVLGLVYLIHSVIFLQIVRHNAKINGLNSITTASENRRRKREVRQFLQFFLITLFPVAYEIAGNVGSNLISDEQLLKVFGVFATTFVLLTVSANGVVYIFFNEVVRAEMKRVSRQLIIKSWTLLSCHSQFQ